MEEIDTELKEVEVLEYEILDLFHGKRDFILMSALTMVTAKVIIFQKRHDPSLDVKHVLDMADEQLRYTVNGILSEERDSKKNN